MTRTDFNDEIKACELSRPLVYVVILNWNGWADTIECLESVLRSDYSNYRVLVCDNSSTDNSLEMIKAWAEGRVCPAVAAECQLRKLSLPPIPKPIPYIEHTRYEAEAGGDRNASTQLILIQTGENRGFAAGNNVGLRYAMARRDHEYIWLLNNDTVVESEALSRLVQETKQKSADMCGSTIMYYFDPGIAQQLGGSRYYHWLGIARLVGRSTRPEVLQAKPELVRNLSFISAASMLVSRRFINEVGFMNEEYFLFFEEIDWITRAKGRCSLAYAPQSIVHHKAGRATGSSHGTRSRSLLSEYYLRRNSVRFTRRYFPHCLPTVYLTLIIMMLNAGRVRRWDSMKVIARILLQAFSSRGRP